MRRDDRAGTKATCDRGTARCPTGLRCGGGRRCAGAAGQLVDEAPLSQSRVFHLVAEVDAQGLVARASAPDDARGVDVTITDAGLETFRKAQEAHLADLDQRLFSRLTWAEVTQLAAITAKLTE